MSNRNKGKAKIEISKPELPPFLQRIKQQIVENEAVERKEQSDRKRKERPKRTDDPEDDPTIVKLNDEDLSEDEYKRLKSGHEEEEIKRAKSPDIGALIKKSDSNKKEFKHNNKKLTYISSSSDDDD